MKILFFTDVHSGSNSEDYYINDNVEFGKKLNALLEKSKECDLIVSCGDMSVFGEGLEKFFEVFKNTKIPLLLIHGNHESSEDVEKFCDGKNIIHIHKKIVEFGGVKFVGYGGGGFNEQDKKLEQWVKQIKPGLSGKIVFITHAPPYETKLDNLPDLGHNGSKSIKWAIKEIEPTIFSCGHFHETFGFEDKINSTLLINPGDSGKILEI